MGPDDLTTPNLINDPNAYFINMVICGDCRKNLSFSKVIHAYAKFAKKLENSEIREK
jgi:hypothetical protein